MKNVVLLMLFSCFGLASSYAQTTQSGFIIDKITHEVISRASVTNLSLKYTILSSELGQFRISAFSGDTLTISCVGFKTQQLVVPTSLTEFAVEMIQEVKVLDEILVKGWSESRFKQEFLRMDLPEKTKIEIEFAPEAMGKPIGNFGRMGFDHATLAPKMTLKGPITLLYDRFSREGKTKRKLNKLTALEIDHQRYLKRMDKSWISRITDLSGTRLESNTNLL
jgi:hypothetical protein